MFRCAALKFLHATVIAPGWPDSESEADMPLCCGAKRRRGVSSAGDNEAIGLIKPEPSGAIS
jgi:hypothetical protein